MIPSNDLSRGYKLYKEEYDRRAIEVLESGYYILGSQVRSFEEEFASRLGQNCFCAGVDNGLNAITLGLHAFDIGPGDEVIMQGNGYIATTLGITQNGATPVFVDNDEYYNLDAAKLEAAITGKTKAVIVTHLYGQCTRMDAIAEICKKHCILLFEDCAQSHFSSYKGVNSGMFGDGAFFSFYPTKNLGCFGDGGAVVSRNKEFIDKIKVLRNYGSDYTYHNILPGYNSRLDEMQAGLLRVKLSHMDELINNRRNIAGRYLSEINNPHISLPKVPEHCQPVWHLFVVNVDDRPAFMEHLKSQGVGSSIHYPQVPYLQPAMGYLGYGEGTCPVSELYCRRVVSLPLMDVMSDEEVTQVIDAVNGYLG